MSRDGQAANAAILVGTLGMPPGTRFETHTHEDHQLLWARTGVVIVAAEAGTWVLPPTRALWIPAHVPHETSSSGRATLRALYLRSRRCPITWSRPQPVGAPPLLTELIDHLARTDLDPRRRGRAEAVLFDLLEPVGRATIEVTMPKDDRASGVARALLDDPAEQRTLAQRGRQVGASARTLARAFVQDTGFPFARWRTSVRLRAALPHLAAGDSVATVARRVAAGLPVETSE